MIIKLYSKLIIIFQVWLDKNLKKKKIIKKTSNKKEIRKKENWF